MASWHEIKDEIRNAPDNYEAVRFKYLNKFRCLRGNRNVIAYYSGAWHNSGYGIKNSLIEDNDQAAFMTLSMGKRSAEDSPEGIARDGVEHKKGLDLILHTPGGDITAAEPIMNFLNKLYGDVEVFVPHLAMSAGTLMALGAKVIHMGTYSSLGPIDPQINGMPTWAILEEFEQFQDDVTKNENRVRAWQPIVSRYRPGLIAMIRKGNEVSKEIAIKLLTRPNGMLYQMKELKQNPDAIRERAKHIADCLTDYKKLKLHNRHISIDDCQKEVLLNVRDLAVPDDLAMAEDREKLQEKDKIKSALLSYHHACDHTLRDNRIGKFVENHVGRVFYCDSERTPTNKMTAFAIPTSEAVEEFQASLEEEEKADSMSEEFKQLNEST